MECQRAKELADRLAELIRPGCTRLEIVGSVKRGDRTECHDIEILVIADTRTPRPEFGQDPRKLPKTMLDKVLADLCQAGELRFLEGGDRLKKYAILAAKTINPFKLELYVVRPETWAIQNVIRTGPSEFSHRFVTPKSLGGLLPDDCRYIRGETRIERNGKTLVFAEEQDALAIIGLGWIAPKDRARVAMRS